MKLTDEDLAKFERCIGADFDNEATLTGDEMRALLAELRSLRALLATPWPACEFSWGEPRVTDECDDQDVLFHGSRYEPEHAIALGAALIRAGLAARGGRDG